jgi:hypothetical protein
MNMKMSDELLDAEVSRRGFMKTTALGGLAVASSTFALPFTRLASAADAITPVQKTWYGVPVP